MKKWKYFEFVDKKEFACGILKLKENNREYEL